MKYQEQNQLLYPILPCFPPSSRRTFYYRILYPFVIIYLIVCNTNPGIKLDADVSCNNDSSVEVQVVGNVEVLKDWTAGIVEPIDWKGAVKLAPPVDALYPNKNGVKNAE